MAGVRRGESTVERAAEDAGRRLADAVEAGTTFGPEADWTRPKDCEGRRGAYVELDATGVRQRGDGGGPAEGRMASVGRVCNPGPEWPRPDERPAPMRARHLAGLYPLEELTPWLRRPAGAAGMDRADRWIGLPDGGAGLEGRLREDFPRVERVILDFYRPAEKLTGLARRLYPEDEAEAEGQARRWRGLLKDEGGAVSAAALSEWDWPRRAGRGGAGRGEAVAERIGYLRRHAHRMEGPDYLAKGWCIGSGAVESACKTVVGQRLKWAGMRWGEEGAHAVCHPRALDRSEKGRWEAFWERDYARD